MSREEGEDVGLEWAMRKTEGTKGGASPLYLGQSRSQCSVSGTRKIQGAARWEWEGKEK